MQYVIALCGALVLNAAANLMMKIGSSQVAQAGGFLQHGPAGALRALFCTPVLLVGLICFGLNAGLYMFALQSKALKISLAYPIMIGGGYAIIATIAYLWPGLRERLTVGQWVGVTLVLAGVILIAIRTPTEVT
ncbi:MAG: hypothetical protein KAV82_00430 [Phycisphaerae bacterium]|nr:hypothetical protein [Phycisphaerae bacterium]